MTDSARPVGARGEARVRSQQEKGPVFIRLPLWGRAARKIFLQFRKRELMEEVKVEVPGTTE